MRAAAALAAGRTRSGDLPVVRSVAAGPSSASQGEGLHRFSDRAPWFCTVANRFHRAVRREKATAILLCATELIEYDAFAAMHEAGSGTFETSRHDPGKSASRVKAAMRWTSSENR